MEVLTQVMEDGGSNGHGVVSDVLQDVMRTVSAGILADLFSLGVCDSGLLAGISRIHPSRSLFKVA